MKALLTTGGGVCIGCFLFAFWNKFSFREIAADIKKNLWLWLILVVVISFFLWLEVGGWQ